MPRIRNPICTIRIASIRIIRIHSQIRIVFIRMSRLIKKPILIPSGTAVTQNGDVFIFKGAKGELKMNAVPGIEVVIEDGKFWVKRAAAGLENEAMLGTFWSLAQNAIQGVTEGYVKTLEIEGVGYRAVVEGGSPSQVLPDGKIREGKELVLYLGYALPVRRAVPDGISISVDKNTIRISGIDKDAVGRAAAEIRALKKPEPYKGKGIHYLGEVIRRKVGKKAGTAA